MRRLLAVLSSLVVLAVFISVARSAPPAAADEVIALTKALWAADMKGDIATQMKNISDDYTEFNPDYSTRLDGKGLSQRLAETAAGASVKTVLAEMSNAKVQTYGDTAILSYNYVGATKDKDGKVTATRAKSTRVYVKQGGQWMLVHANFASAD